jgi:hypothetical protein
LIDAYNKFESILTKSFRSEVLLLHHAVLFPVCSAFIIPLVLFASALVIQLAWFKLRRRLLRPWMKLRWFRGLRQHGMCSVPFTGVLSYADVEQGRRVPCTAPYSMAIPATTTVSNTMSCPPVLESPFAASPLSVDQASILPPKPSSPWSLAAAALPQHATCPADFGQPHRTSFAHGMSFHYYFWEHFFATALVVFFGTYTNLATVALGLLMCVQTDVRTGTNSHRKPVQPSNTAIPNRWLMDVRLSCPIPCKNSAWAIWANIVGGLLLVVCIGGPIGIACVLWRQAWKGNLKGHITAVASDPDALTKRTHRSIEDHITARLAFRYADYNCNYEVLKYSSSTHGQRRLDSELFQQRLRAQIVLAWDSVLDLFRFLLAVAALCVTLHELHQLIMVALFLSMYLILILAFRPWKSAKVWRLQVWALVCLVFSCLGTMACNVSDVESYYGASTGKQQQAISLLVIIVNGVYALCALFALMRCVHREAHMAEIWHKFRGRVRSYTEAQQLTMRHSIPPTASRQSQACAAAGLGA